MLLLFVVLLFPGKADAFPWLVSAKRAQRELKAGATLLDARGRRSWQKGHIAGAQPTSWQDFSRSQKHKMGLLLSSAKLLGKKLRKLGVSSHKVVLVVGDVRNGWGEEGRIVWMLRSLGHRKAAMIDGGNRGLRALGLKWTKLSAPAKAGRFQARWNPRWLARKNDVKQQMGRVLFLDTRERREFRGATPYGEKRGGHLPGAKHLHFKALLRRNGKLRSRRQLRRILKRKGISQHQKIVAYCTGGIRSAWVVVVLKALGYRNVRNYDGSMWEWSSLPAKQYPLRRTKNSP
jgi:thiosulfate/3-mercaptopyruvate sulfurtransferase